MCFFQEDGICCIVSWPKFRGIKDYGRDVEWFENNRAHVLQTSIPVFKETTNGQRLPSVCSYIPEGAIVMDRGMLVV